MASQQIDKSWTPILKVEKQFQVGKTDKMKVVRKQFPLKAAEAMTIHKSQGSTLNKIAVSFKGRVGKHMVYVALSRVRSLEGLSLIDFDANKIKIDALVEQEMTRLRTHKELVKTTTKIPVSELTIICHNARSLHNNIKHYRKDHRLMNTDVIVVQETWAKKNDSKEHYAMEGFQDPVCLYTDNNKHRPHSGTFIYVKQGIAILSSTHTTELGIEGSSVEIRKGNKLYEVISVYCHPPGNVNKICTAVKKLHRQNVPLVIGGDMNIDQLKPSKCQKLYDFLKNTVNALPALCMETTDYHSALDHIYTTETNYKTGVLETYWSDHKMTWISFLD
jgi:exonuclease III